MPALLACAVAYCFLWPGCKGIEHVVILTLLGVVIVQRSLYRFRKIPFACSYLPGKSNLKVKLGVYGILFLFLCNTGVQIEAVSLQGTTGFAILALILLAAAVWSWRRTLRMAASPDARVQFEEVPVTDILALDLGGDAGAWTGETYVDGVTPREPVSLGTMIEQSVGDFSSAIRALGKSLPFTVAAIALIAVGIGANTAIFSMIHGVLTKPAPGMKAERLVSFAQMIHGETQPAFSYSEYLDYALNTQTMRSLAAYGGARFSVTGPDGSYELRAQRVTPNYFDTLGVRLVRGRSFTPDEARGATGLTAVIAYHIWQNQFHGDGDIIGRTISVSGIPATIVGVTVQGFRGPQFVPNFEIGVPIAADSRLRGTDRNLLDRGFRYVAIIGKLASRATMSQAQAEFDVMSKYVQTDPVAPIRVAPYSATAFGPWQSAQAHMFGRIITAVGLLTLLIVCANVANLMLARSVVRQREMAVRRSLGASHLRILRLLMSEGLVLALAASAAALLFASWASRAIVKLIPPLASGARIEPDLTPDTQVALYTLALAVGSALAFTIAPAVRAWRQELLPWLRSGENSVAPGRSALSRFLAVAQLALCVLLLTGAGLASRSVYLIAQRDLHFAKDHLLLVGINTAGAAAARDDAVLLARLFERLRAVPGVVSVSYASAVPASNFGGWSASVQAAGGSESVRTNGMYAAPRVPRNAGGSRHGRARHNFAGRGFRWKICRSQSQSGANALARPIGARPGVGNIRRDGNGSRRGPEHAGGRARELRLPAGSRRRGRRQSNLPAVCRQSRCYRSRGQTRYSRRGCAHPGRLSKNHGKGVGRGQWASHPHRFAAWHLLKCFANPRSYRSLCRGCAADSQTQARLRYPHGAGRIDASNPRDCIAGRIAPGDDRRTLRDRTECCRR